MANAGKLSATKLATYEGCSLVYFLKYIAHEKVQVNARLLFGKHIHYMLEDFYKKNFKSEESFVNSGKYRWRALASGEFLKGKQKENLVTKIHKLNNGYELKIGNHVNFGENPVGIYFAFRNLGNSLLESFYRKHKGKKPPKKVEFAFGVRNDSPFKINGHLVRGAIDRIDNLNKTWYITDYKTDKKSPEENNFILDRNPQFTIYSYAFREIFQEKEDAILYYHLRSGKVFKTKRTEKDFDYLKSLLDKVSEGVSREIFIPFYGFHCNFCDYQEACANYSIDYKGNPKINKKRKNLQTKISDDWVLPEWMNLQEE